MTILLVKHMFHVVLSFSELVCEKVKTKYEESSNKNMIKFYIVINKNNVHFMTAQMD